jgi:hypothetical protein
MHVSDILNINADKIFSSADILKFHFFGTDVVWKSFLV